VSTSPVITAWSAYSAYGAGRDRLARGLAAGESAVTAIDGGAWGTLDSRAALIPGFDTREVLGKKNTRGMSRLSGIAVATVRMLQEEVAGDQATGLVLGTTTGSAEAMMEITRRSLVASRPYLIDAALIPYAVMNGAAGQCAIWHEYKGPNATIAAGRPSGLAALGYARRLLLAGRASLVIAGGAEEYSRARSWLEFHSAPDGTSPAPLGEGCAMFAVAARPPEDRPVLAGLLAVNLSVCVDGGWGTTVERSVRTALRSAGRDPGDVWVTCGSGAPGQAGKAELAVLSDVTSAQVELPPLPGLLGETHSASSAFQLAAVLCEAARSAQSTGKVAVITSVDPPSGTVATTVLLLGDERGR
jgi:3-oxoacyl-[acyl-carrier-protein] synthase II